VKDGSDRVNRAACNPRSQLCSGRGPNSQEHNLVGVEESRKTPVECDEPSTFCAIGFVADYTVGKVAAAREHRDPGLGRGTLDFDRTDGN